MTKDHNYLIPINYHSMGITLVPQQNPQIAYVVSCEW